MAAETKVGERIRSFREHLNMSVESLATKCAVDASVIAAIESGAVLPALGILTKISRALGQRLGTFMDDQFTPDPIVTRAVDLASTADNDRVVAGKDYHYRSLAVGKPDRHMDPFHIELPADGSEILSSHEGEELIICITGEVKLTYGEEVFTLTPGDTAYYNTVVKHCVSAAGNKPATIYGVVFMPV